MQWILYPVWVRSIKDIRDIKVPISDMWSEPYFFQKIYEDSVSVYNYYNELWC